MKCPACANELTPYYANHMTLDICRDSCGGIWFDAFELQKMDEVQEPMNPELLSVKTNLNAPLLAGTEKRICPKCAGIAMMRHFYSPQRKIMVDECPSCGGYWLDAGELAAIRQETQMEKERKRAGQARLNQLSLRALANELVVFQSESGQQPSIRRKLQAMNASVQTLLRRAGE